MAKIKKFTFNPFQENTYVLYQPQGECIIVDPGCFNSSEKEELSQFIKENKLTPIQLLNTHLHIDHVLGNKFVAEKYDLGVSAFKSDYPMMEMVKSSASLYGIPYEESPDIENQIKEGDQITLGETTFEVLFIPGHAPDHIVLVDHDKKLMIGGDTLFKGSIGRTDLPGGNHEDLLNNIREKLFVLDENIIVYSGHGPETTIGDEKRNNPFFNR